MTGARRDSSLILLLAGWAALSIAAIFLRPLWPVDETRYVSVAWEMWQRGDFLVPYLNGEPYSHKPPLLFWLIHLGWAAFGVNDWWPRLISPLLGLACIPLLQRLARRLWPALPTVGETATWALFGTLLFALFVTLTMFDLLLAWIVLLGMLAIVQAAQGERHGLVLLGVAIGLGVVAKGPVILLHLLPAALLAPWWQTKLRTDKRRWYLGVLGAVLLGAAIGLAWALPAAYVGGEIYRHAILWGQTAGRVSESFAHRAPWWYYLPLLPAMLYPWFVWPSFWRGLRGQRSDAGVRFLLAWLVPVFVGFSLISGKQEKYLLPLVPVFALLVGFALARAGELRQRLDTVLPALGYLLLGLAWWYVASHPQRFHLPAWAAGLPSWPAGLLIVLGAVLAGLGRAPMATRLRALSLATLIAVGLIYVTLIRTLAPYNDPAPIAQRIAALQARGVPVAYWGKYHAQFSFAGRLQQPLAILNEATVGNWIAAHPQGRVVLATRTPFHGAGGPEWQQPFRGIWTEIWDGAALLRAHQQSAAD